LRLLPRISPEKKSWLEGKAFDKWETFENFRPCLNVDLVVAAEIIYIKNGVRI
jgi:hypothetical protein